jgi:hypothetical protein
MLAWKDPLFPCIVSIQHNSIPKMKMKTCGVSDRFSGILETHARRTVDALHQVRELRRSILSYAAYNGEQWQDGRPGRTAATKLCAE